MASSPARARIVRTGWVEDRDLAALLRRAAVLAYPSLYEGFGFPPLQAMRAGVPVVATQGRIGARGRSGTARCLVEPGDSEGFAAALERCLADEVVRRDLDGRGFGVGGPLLVGVLRRRARAVVPRRFGGPAWLTRPRRCSLAVEQLRREVPGGIGNYARGLLAGLQRCAEDGDGVEVTLLASRAPRAGTRPAGCLWTAGRRVRACRADS